MPYGAIAVDTFQNSNGQTISTQPPGFRNRIINGDMRIDQRYAGGAISAATLGSSGYTVDRWAYAATQSAKFSAQQNQGSVTPPTGFSNYLGFTSSSAYSVVASDVFYFNQRIEGFNFADMAWGTANAKTVTLSFWVYSSLTGTFGGSLNNSAGNRYYPFSYTVSSANTWTLATVTIAGDTSGTWIGATNGIGVQVNFGLGAGSTYSGTSGVWASSVYLQPTGTVSVVGTNGATFYITGVQLEVGSQATSFDYRDYGRELSMCYRYFQSIPQPTLRGVLASTTSAARCGCPLVVPMRAAPTTTISGSPNLFDGSGVSAFTVQVNYSTFQNLEYDFVATTAMNAQRPCILYQQGGAGTFLLSAEL